MRLDPVEGQQDKIACTTPAVERRSEPETIQTAFRDVPMRESQVRGSRAADFDRLLLLHELPGSRTSI
jgi:hypothetical protein